MSKLKKNVKITWSETTPDGIVNIVAKISEEDTGQKYIACHVLSYGSKDFSKEASDPIEIPVDKRIISLLKDTVKIQKRKDVSVEDTPFKKITKK